VPAPADLGPARWPDLRLRIASAAVLVPVALLALWLGGALWAGLVVLAALGLAWEWVRLCGGDWRRWPGIAVPLAMLAALGLGLVGLWPAAWLLVGLGGLALAFRDGWLGFGLAYLGVAALALLGLRQAPGGAANVLFVLAIVWASDIGAYFAGRALGGPKLAPGISPNKTWSGAVGGLFAAVTVGLTVASAVGGLGKGWLIVAALAALLGIASQVGDLFESWLKRRYHVKDSSSLIPGHGGLLDRLDGVLAAAPIAALALLVFGAGRVLWP